MATQAELNQAQLLYVAYYGRPADPAGLEFWAEQIAQVGVAGIAADFGNSAEFEAEFGDLGSVALINNLYQQLFGRDAEAEGLQYWLDVLADGAPLASIALEIAGGAQGGDATGLQNKVTLANQFTAAVAAGDVAYDGADAAAYGRAFLATINENTNVEAYDVQAVVDGIASGVLPVDTADLRAALEDLREAEANLADFLQGALENESVEEALVALDPENPTDAEITTAIGVAEDNTEAALDALVTGDFTGAGTNAKAGLIADERALLQGLIDDEQETLDELNASINEVAGLRTALTNYSNALATQEEANAAATDAANQLTGAEATFAARNSLTVDDVIITATDVSIDDGTVVTPVFTLVDGEWELVPGAEEVNGLNDLQTSLQANTDALAAQTDAAAAVGTATTALNAVDRTGADAEISGAASGVAVNDLLVAQEDALEAAQDDLAELETAVEAWEAAVALSTELTDLNTAVTDALAYIEDSVEDGGLGFNLLNIGDAASAADDVYLFEDNVGAGNAATIAGFGDEGVDRIFFGPDYKLVQLGEGESITDRVGSASELEIFWEDTDAGLMLYVEAGAEAGRDLDADEITTITLTGVTSEDISFSSGFLSVGTAEIA